MNENQTLREQMWDLCYGLLSAEEVAALHKQIKSDPAAARLYAEVRLQADLVASASKVEDASVTLSVPDEGRKVQPAAKSHSGAGESPFRPGKSGRAGKKLFAPSYRAANWLAALAATALLALIGYGLYAPMQFGGSALPDSIVASVYSRQPLQSGLTQNLKVVATNGRGEPASTALAWSVRVDGNVVEQDVVQTDKSGEVQFSLPGSSLQPGAILEVQAQGDKQKEGTRPYFQANEHHRHDWAEVSSKFVVPLAPKPEPVIADVRFEQDSYQPGETFRFWSHSRRAFSNQPTLEADEWKLVASDGREIQPAAIEARPEAGVVSGAFQIPADGPQGYYRLVAVNHKAGTSEDLEHVPVGMDVEQTANLARRFAGADRSFRMLMQRETPAEMSAEKAEEKQARKLSMATKRTELAAAAPGGVGGAPPAPGAVPPLPAPATAPAGPAAAKAPAAPRGDPVADAPPREKESPKPGLAGSLRNAQSAEEKGDRKGGQHGDEQQTHASFEEKKEKVAQSSGDTLVVEVPAELSHLNLRAVVTKSNVTVATQEYQGHSLALNDLKQIKEMDSGTANGPAPIPAAEPVEALAKKAKDAEGDDRPDTSRKLTVPLPPEADGELGVTLYDQTVVPAKPVYRQLVRRASARDLNIGIEPEGTDISPRQEMRLKLTVTDQNGVAVPHSYFAARIVKADAAPEVAAAEGAPTPASRYAADKMEGAVGGRGRSTAGAGFGGGKGIDAKDADAKEEKQDAPQPKEESKREGKEAESKLKKAQDGLAKPDELAANAAPPAPAAAASARPGDFEKFSSSSGEIRSDFAKQRMAKDQRPRGERAPATTYSEGLSEEAPVASQEILLGSNDSLIRDAERAEEMAAQVAQANFQRMVGKVVLMVAAAALLLFGLLAMLHRPAQAKVWIPAMVVVAASFGIGCFWLMNGNFSPRQVVGTAALAPESATPVKRYTEEPKPMAPANGSLPPPAMDDRSGMEMDKVNEGSIRGVGPTVLMPGAPADAVGSKSAQLGFPSGGGSGLAGGKPNAPRTAAPKTESTDAKPSEPDASTKPPPDDVKKKMADNRQNADPSKAEAAKDAVAPKKSGAAAPPEKPLAMKSAKTEPQGEKRAKAAKLLWAPNLPANEKGEAELNIQLPAEAGDYYLLVDVQGPSGFGTVQSRIRVPAPAPAAPAAPAPAAKPEPSKP